jgi:hypothetical protein
MKTITKLWALLVVLTIASPLGIILPAFFKAGAAWGEWNPEEIKEMLGYIPAGLQRLCSVWDSLMTDYSFRGLEGGNLFVSSLAYLFSGMIGVGLVAGAVFLMAKLLIKRR